ncbi:MAG: leucine-rich repeat domain-containing protein [Saprospiraceae bacterium]
MKKRVLFLFLPLLIGGVAPRLVAQNCRSIFEQAQNALAKRHFDQALRKLQDNEICDIRNEMLQERQYLYNAIFQAVSDLRNKAERDADSLKASTKQLREAGEALQTALNEARDAKRLVDDALEASKRNLERATSAETEAVVAGRRSDSLLTVANNILGSLYFYENRFALAYDGLRYGFMDRSGKPVIPFRYNTAAPFDQETGLAQVGRNYQQFLLDTAGREYLLAQSLVPFNASVEAVYLSSQTIDFLPGWFFAAKQLRYVALDNNRLVIIGRRIGELTNLEQLDLSQNYLGKIPDEIATLNKLTRLDLGNNRLRELPGVWRLPALTSLNLGYNRLREFTPEVFDSPNLRQLNLSNNRLTTVPPMAVTCTQLELLDLSGNELTAMPLLQNTHFPNLTVLDLGRNQFDSVPLSLGNLTCLRELRLALNQITELPPELGRLTSLELLDLSHNALEALPESFKNMTNLREVNLAGNRLTELPAWLAKLPRLEKVYIGGNLISTIPKGLKGKVE